MRNDESKTEGPAAGTQNTRLPARVFYGIIVVGVVLGAVLCAAGGWAYLEFSEKKPTGRRIWAAEAATFVIPISVMVGATFGGLAGVLGAILWERRKS